MGVVDSTYVAAEFPGQGLWHFHLSSINYAPPGGGWEQLTANNASSEAVDPNGYVVAEFPGQGVWFYTTPGTWQGVGGWQQLTAADASGLAVNGIDFGFASAKTSMVAAAFSGHGVWRIPILNPAGPGAWQQLTASDASTVSVNASGDVVGEFPGWGVWAYLDSKNAASLGWGTGWNHLTAADASLVGIDDTANIYGQYFYGWGVWYDQVASWRLLTPSNASSFGVGG